MAKVLTLLRKDEKSSSEEEERRKEEGSAVSGLYHHPPSSSERARSFPRSAHFPRIRAIAVRQGRGFPCGHRRFGVRRTWRVRVAGRQADDARTFVLYASRLVAIFCGNCRLLLLELLPPSFCTTHSARPPAPPPPRKSTSAMSISLPNGTLLAASSSSHLQLSAAVTRILHLANFSAEQVFPAPLPRVLTLHADSRPATSSSCSRNGTTTRAATG